MTIAYIKSDTLRRSLIVVLIPILPVLFAGIAIIKAVDAFIEEMKDQWGHGSGGIWTAIRDCWHGEDVRRNKAIMDDPGGG